MKLSAKFHKAIEECCLCPRECHANRLAGPIGFCRTGSGLHIASICIHRGEEPAISGKRGICNVFFNHCNLQCVYCQNYQISSNKTDLTGGEISVEHAAAQIVRHLENGCTHVGFVSPSHAIPQMLSLIEAIRLMGQNPVYVYNTSAYDKPEILQRLEGVIDVYLPDLKYMSEKLAQDFSSASNYPEVAKAAVKEMYRQKGSTLIFDENDSAVSGLIIRHLVLPGQVENSKEVLRFIAEELSPLVHVSLMSQYYPTAVVKDHPMLGKQISIEEYEEVAEEMEKHGIFRGWIQETESYENYRPDFDRCHPFEG